MARVMLGVFGLAVTAVGMWVFRVVTARSNSVPYGVLSALIAVTIGGLLVYTALRPDVGR